jgi:hypothetical protein
LALLGGFPGAGAVSGGGSLFLSLLSVLPGGGGLSLLALAGVGCCCARAGECVGAAGLCLCCGWGFGGGVWWCGGLRVLLWCLCGGCWGGLVVL